MIHILEDLTHKLEGQPPKKDVIWVLPIYIYKPQLLWVVNLLLKPYQAIAKESQLKLKVPRNRSELFCKKIGLANQLIGNLSRDLQSAGFLIHPRWCRISSNSRTWKMMVWKMVFLFLGCLRFHDSMLIFWGVLQIIYTVVKVDG